MSAPFWRVYLHQDKNLSLTWGDKHFTPSPTTAALIAPNTPCEGHAKGPTHQFFVHFSLAHPWDTIEPGVFEVTLPQSFINDIWALTASEPSQDKIVFSPLVTELVSKGLSGIALPTPAHHSDETISRVCELLQGAYVNPPALDQLAQRFHMSTNSLLRRFKKAQGCSPHQYVLNLRINRASNMLVHTDESLDDIAVQLGFCDRYTFSRHFKKRSGIPPAAFRRFHATGNI